MSFKKTLRTILLGVALGLSGCGDTKEEKPLFRDLNGDGNQDMVYCIKKVTGPLSGEHRVYVKYNEGDGKFGKPQLLTETSSEPGDVPIISRICRWSELGEEYK